MKIFKAELFGRTLKVNIARPIKMKDGHYSRPVWADDAWLAKYAGKTLEEDNVGADGGVSAEYVPGATATIGKLITHKSSGHLFF